MKINTYDITEKKKIPVEGIYAFVMYGFVFYAIPAMDSFNDKKHNSDTTIIELDSGAAIVTNFFGVGPAVLLAKRRLKEKGKIKVQEAIRLLIEKYGVMN